MTEDKIERMVERIAYRNKTGDTAPELDVWKLAKVLVEVEKRIDELEKPEMDHDGYFTHRNGKCEYKDGFLAALEEMRDLWLGWADKLKKEYE